jgi:hypothetical protein
MEGGILMDDFREIWADHLAHLLSKQRCMDQVYMDGSHNPLPTEIQKSRRFIDDLMDSIEGRL